ncbi:MAG TPA: hypothetical protein EYP35_08545 [Desulfobacterales bacterium]|nr:hypothetical protein [Desulfobacterales bacterium]HIP38726.1 hypothetical protein [Desulfocapsa sulfexigens]
MDCSKKIHRTFSFLLLLVLTVFLGNAWAVQSHAAPEGLYVHQMAHVFYSFALCYLFWNVFALTGHTLSGYVDKSVFGQQSDSVSTTSQKQFNSLKLWFYFTRIDHLVSVPAFGFLFFRMRTIYRDRLKEEDV